MKKSLLIGLSLSATVFAMQAQAMEFGNPISSTVLVKKDLSVKGEMQPSEKEVVLMNIKLSPQQKQKFLSYKSSVQSKMMIKSTAGLPLKVDQGMNGTPVLDQGRHGSCVTFATTAAVDALIGKGDYVSQLCNLELGSYLEKRSYYPSGWDGSWGPYILNQMHQFGIVSKDTQKSKSCAGMTEYPARDKSSTGTAMSADDFKQVSEDIGSKIYWEPILSVQQRVQWDGSKTNPGADILSQVKQTLNSKLADGSTPRVTFAVLLPVAYCHAGLCASFHAKEDTWALTDAIKKDNNPEFGGHEMVITGYDDQAVATDNEGKKHQGLLYLRNSWGTNAGDNGNFYMTYDFFNLFVLEAQKVAFRQDKE